MKIIWLPLAASLLLVACVTDADGPGRRTIIDSRDSYDPRSLDPAFSTDVPTGRAVAYVFDGLTRFSHDASLQPGLATSWDVSPDGLEYTFHLRVGVLFHDGTPFTAHQVPRSFMRVLDPSSTAGRGWPLLPIAGARAFAEGRSQVIEGIRVVDDSTVVIRLAEALSVFPKMLAMPVASIVPETIGADFGERPIGTGPWRFVEWRHDDYLLFARNDSYFDGRPAQDSLKARIIPEPSTAVAEFESGNVDVLFVPEGETARWRGDSTRASRLQSVPSLRLWYIALNTRRGILQRKEVRQALNHAVDITTILEQLLGGRGKRAAGVIPPTLEGADPSRSPYAYDSTRARQMLQAAGVAEGTELELWHSQDPTFSRVAQAVQGYLAKAGVTVKLVQRDAASVREAARKGDVDMYVKDWWADYPDAENFLYPLLHSSSAGVGGNVSYLANAQFDALVNRSRTESDLARRAELYREADALIFDEAPMIFLFFSEDLYAVQPWLSGFNVPAIFNGQRWTGVSIGGG